MKALITFLLILFIVPQASFSQDYTTSVTFPAGYQVGDYIEFLQVAPEMAGASGYYEISIAYTRGNVAAAATHLASISHANPALWREVGRINNNVYVYSGWYNFTIDCNTQYGNSRFRIRAVSTLGVTESPLPVVIKVHAINFNSAWTALNNTGNDLSVTKYNPMTNDWSLYVGNPFTSDGANLALRAIENGNVGIGTISPSTKLHVSLSTTTNQISKQSDLGGYLHLSDYSSSINAKTGIVSSFQSAPGIASGVVFGRYGSAWGTYVGFHTHSDDANALDDLTEKMRIDGNGNVGIGTTTPREKLSVNGKIRAQEIKVEAAPWPDYVFALSYKLPDLKATEQFIKENKHLPEMPSAAEVAKDGVNLGEINALLLKKIEEMTLHLIEQNKRLDEQDKKNAVQQKEIELLKSKL